MRQFKIRVSALETKRLVADLCSEKPATRKSSLKIFVKLSAGTFISDDAGMEAAEVLLRKGEIDVLIFLFSIKRGVVDDSILNQFILNRFLVLAQAEETRDEVVEKAGVSVFISFLSDPNPNMQCLSVGVLFYLSKKRSAHGVRMIAQNVVAPVLNLLYAKHEAIKIYAAGVIWNVALCEWQNRPREMVSEVIKLDGLKALLQVLDDEDSAGVHGNVLGSLAFLAYNPINHPMILQEIGVKRLLPFLSVDYEDVRLRTVRIILGLSHCKTNHKILREEGVTGLLFDLMFSEDNDLRGFVMEALFYLSWSAGNQKELIDLGGIKTFVLLAASKEDVLRIGAIRILSVFSATLGYHAILKDQGIILLSILLLKEVSLEVQQYALDVLFRLSANRANHRLMIEQGAILSLMPFLSHENTVFQQLSAGALGNLSVDLSSQDKISTSHAIPSLVRLLDVECLATRSYAVMAIWNLMDNCWLNTERGLIEKGENSLNAFLPEMSVDDFITNSAENRKVIAREGAIAPLVSMLSLRESNIDGFAAGALKSLSVDVDNKQRVADAGAIKPLVCLLACECVGVQSQAAAALKNLAVNTANRIKIARSGGVTALYSLLSSADVELRKNASGAIWLLALNPEIKAEIIELDGIDHVVELNLSYISLSFEQSPLLFDFIAKSKCLQSVNLSHIAFTDKEVNMLLEAIIRNKSITYLDVRYSGLRFEIINSLNALLCRNSNGKHCVVESGGSAVVSQPLVKNVPGASASRYEIADHYDAYRCAIGKKIMRHPVLAADGETYERDLIEEWFIGNDTSPQTGAVFSHKSLFPNKGLLRCINRLLFDRSILLDPEQIYMSADLVEKVCNGVQAGEVETVIAAIKADRWLLTRPLFDGDHLLVFVLKQSLKFLPIIIIELGGEFWKLPEIEKNGGASFFRLAAYHLGIKGVEIIKGTLKWSQSQVQSEYEYAKKEGDRRLMKACLRLGAKSLSLKVALSQLSIICSDDEEQEPDLELDPVLALC